MTEAPMSERQDVEKLAKKARAEAREQEREAAMGGDLSGASYYAGVREGFDKAQDIMLDEIAVLKGTVERLRGERDEAMREADDMEAAARAHRTAAEDIADTLQREVEALRDAERRLLDFVGAPCLTELLGDDLGHECGCMGCSARAYVAARALTEGGE